MNERYIHLPKGSLRLSGQCSCHWNTSAPQCVGLWKKLCKKMFRKAWVSIDWNRWKGFMVDTGLRVNVKEWVDFSKRGGQQWEAWRRRGPRWVRWSVRTLSYSGTGRGGEQAEQKGEIKFILWAESDLSGPDNKMETFDFEMTKGNAGLFFFSPLPTAHIVYLSLLVFQDNLIILNISKELNVALSSTSTHDQKDTVHSYTSHKYVRVWGKTYHNNAHIWDLW